MVVCDTSMNGCLELKVESLYAFPVAWACHHVW